MDTFHYPGNTAAGNTLLVLLPGLHDDALDFDKQGFVDATQRLYPELDLIAVDAHYGYYAERTFVQRLHSDVIAPARRSGYERIVLAGVSLGGYGSLLYLREYQNDLDSVFLIAPFLGTEAVINSIQDAGSLKGWTAPDVRDPIGSIDIWLWLREHTSPDFEIPAIHLAYGTEDRYAAGQSLLADQLPHDRVTTVPGGHNWRTWHRLWQKLIRQADFANQVR